MHALIDGDILAYSYGALVKRHTHSNDGKEFCPELEIGQPLPFEVCWGGVQRLISHIADATNSDKVTVYLSSKEKPTWRFNIATIQPYKGNRKQDKEKPTHWQNIRDNLPIHYTTVIAEGIEADDAMAIAQYTDIAHGDLVGLDPSEYHTVICTLDKDLMMVPGWHYNWDAKPNKMIYQDELSGLKCFYKQLLTGDSTDNILGLFGVGPKSTLLKDIDNCQSEAAMACIVSHAYKQRFGSYWHMFMLETGRLLWMMRTPDDLWKVPEVCFDGQES